ncbi:MAG TPA: glycosyltransferase [Dongiaceae bacterium]|nr:glycosyltransferase [Dongiaceae bacterium]
MTCSDPAADDLVSIVIPVFNGAKYVGRAIYSALAQTWPHREVIVVDDGSDDGGATERVLAGYGAAIRVVRKANGGVATALNAGIDAMRGSWFSWLSHDDLYYPRKIERYLEILRNVPEPAIAFGDVDIVDEHDQWQRRAELTRGFQGTDGRWAVLEGRINGCAMLIPRSCLEACGRFDPGLPTTQDCAYWFRLAGRFPFIPIGEVLVGFREHPDQGSRTARHLEEVSLLWARMLERLEEEVPTASTVERLRWLRRAERFLRRAPYTGARAYAKSRLDALLETTPITVLLPARGTADIESVMTAVAAAGGKPARIAVIDRTESAAAALSLAVHPRLRDMPIMRLSENAVRNDRSALLLEAAALDADILAFLDPAALPATEALRDGFLTVATGEADGWLPRIESPAAMLPQELCGTVLDRRALEIARSAQDESPMTALGRNARLAECVAIPPQAAPSAPPTPRPPLRRLEPGVPPILARPMHGGRPTLLMLVHGWGGGTIRYTATLAEWIGTQVNLLYGWAVDNTRFYLSSLGPDVAEIEIDLGDGVDALPQAVRQLEPDRIDVIHSVGFDDLLEDFLDGLGLPFDVTFLDYHHLAKEPHVLNAAGEFVGDDALLSRDHPLRRPGPPRLALRAAERRIACSRDLAARIGRLAPELDIIPARLPESGNPSGFALHAPPLAEGETMRVLYLGRMTKSKGLRLVEGVGKLIAERGLDLRIDCLGADDSFPAGREQGPHGIRLLGGYRQEDLNPLICRLRPHLAWLPFTAPESHSFALSDAMLQGLPILATGIGAVTERMAARPGSWLLSPEEATVEGFAAWLARLQNERLATPPRWLPTEHLPPLAEGFYERDYLRPLFHSA